MSAALDLNLTDLPKGPDLLLRNAFRLAQMSVDTPDRKLNRRHKRIERALSLGTEPPAGDLPIFPADELRDNPDELKDALHRIGDPVVRLFDELFWFWPAKFGDGNNDSGLQLIADNKIDEAAQHWLAAESETENFVSTHNLALLYQFQALSNDNALLSKTETAAKVKTGLFGFGGDKTDKTTRKQWYESLKRWQLLGRQDSFWAYLRDRIRAIDDPRLPVSVADWLREHLPLVVLSVNVGLALKAAQRSLDDQVARQRQILDVSGFDAEAIDGAYSAAAEQYRERAARMCKALVDDVERDALAGDSMIGSFHDQAGPILAMLGQLYPGDDRGIRALHDEVAEAMRSALVKYCRKTEDWETAHALILKARDLARGDKVVASIGNDLKAIEENKDSDSSWCKKGYFDLQPDCLAVLEQARELAGANRFDDAIDVLRGVLIGRPDVPEAARFGEYFLHCLVCLLRDKAWHCRGQGIEEFNAGHARLINDSVQYNGYYNDSAAACSGCGRGIYGQYTVRTIAGAEHPFCPSCNQRIISGVERLDQKLDPSLRMSLDLTVLADHLLSGSKATLKALEVMTKEAAERSVTAADPEWLKSQMNLCTASELIAQLENPEGCAESANAIYARLSRLISQQSDENREQTLNQLFAITTGSREQLQTLLPLLFTDSFVFSQFIKHAIAADTDQILAALEHVSNFALKFEIVDLINRQHTSPAKLTAAILETLTFDVASIVNAGQFSFDDGDLAELLARLASYDADDLDERLILCAIQTYLRGEEERALAPLLRAVHANPEALSVFYRFLGATAEPDTTEDKRTLIESLKRSDDPRVLFSVMQQLADSASDPELLAELEASASELIVSRASTELHTSAATWIDGYVANALSYAANYRPDWAGLLVEQIIVAFTAGVPGENFRTDCARLLAAVSAAPADLQMLLDFVSGERDGMNAATRKTFVELMASHWDSAVRLFALRQHVERADSLAIDKLANDEQFIATLIRFLADADDALRTFAFEQLQHRPDGLLTTGLPALATTDNAQRQLLLTLLEDVDLASVHMRKPMAPDTLIRLAGVTTEPTVLNLLTRCIDVVYASGQAEKPTRQTIGLCRSLVKSGSRLQRQMAHAVLGTTGRFLNWRVQLYQVAAGAAWWLHEVLQVPADLRDEVTREARDARADLAGSDVGSELSRSDPVLQSPRSLRKSVVDLAKQSSGQSRVACPVCQASVRPKNLVRHFDKVHKKTSVVTVDVPSAPLSNLSLNVDFPPGSVARPIGEDIWPVLTPADDPGVAVGWFRPALLATLLAAVLGLHLTDHPALRQLADSGAKHAFNFAQNPMVRQAASDAAGMFSDLASLFDDYPDAEVESAASRVRDEIVTTAESVSAPALAANQIPEAISATVVESPVARDVTVRDSQVEGARRLGAAERDVCRTQPDSDWCRNRVDRAGIPLPSLPDPDDATPLPADTSSALARARRSLSGLSTLDSATGAGNARAPEARTRFSSLNDAAAAMRQAEQQATAIKAKYQSLLDYAAWAQREASRAQTDANRTSGAARKAAEQLALSNLAEVAMAKVQAQALAAQLRGAEEAAARTRQEAIAYQAQLARAEAARVEVAKAEAAVKRTQPQAKTTEDTVKPTTVQKASFGKNELRELQRRLTGLGYKPGPVDGVWGSKTRRAMQAFQKKQGLAQTEKLNIETLRAVRRQSR